MVEVFKTNVRARRHARRLVEQIHQTFAQYRANFDLDDCDNILRVETSSDFIPAAELITLLRAAGFQAEVLPDEPALVAHHYGG
ncbi:hypothetical protein [Hymenobacter chitinivorans]|uniref:Uncharacterized protein n=1 Tax=Hymenobacter chitinivorans DSM 11115 TaxID=1121954 RepID=A0A2M9AS56_9BACT|nr:hypothetical protein [Hymenobacter chitinivorans]PJJ48532.1 hypothetical protein CLV45_4241 [Hymenobacter chitinivorans DSM 11115]